MQYQITTGKKPDEVKLVVNIDQIPALAIPPVIAIGTGDKGKAYRQYLDKKLFNDPQLTNSLVKMHDMGIENQGMHLQCHPKCRFSKFHAQVLKDIFTEHAETFSSLISYLVPGSKNATSKEPSDDVKGDGMEQMTMGTQTTLDQLNVPGADQLRALIAADMEKERLEAERQPDIVDAEIVSESVRTPQVTQATE